MLKLICRIILYIGYSLFFICMALGILQQSMVSSNGTDDYMNIHGEYVAPDMIQSVIYDNEAKIMYVGYFDAPCVNTYTYDGEFLWSVMTPYFRARYYDVIDDDLIIYDSEQAYLYNCKSGEFKEIAKTDDLSLSYEYENGEFVSVEDMTEGDLYYDRYQVYEMTSVGSLREIVSRPWWYVFFGDVPMFFVGLSGAVCIIISSVMRSIERKRQDKFVRSGR